MFQIGNNTPTQSSHIKIVHTGSESKTAYIICLLNSTLFYWYNWQYSNCHDLSLYNIETFPFIVKGKDLNMKGLCNRLMEDYKKNSTVYKRISKGIITKFDSFYPAKSKPIIDEIDKVLAKHYGFTEEELDFIINYDIKYRMGDELNEE